MIIIETSPRSASAPSANRSNHQDRHFMTSPVPMKLLPSWALRDGAALLTGGPSIRIDGSVLEGLKMRGLKRCAASGGRSSSKPRERLPAR
jgi:hypothetical protein